MIIKTSMFSDCSKNVVSFEVKVAKNEQLARLARGMLLKR